jgi:acyl carrier protein
MVPSGWRTLEALPLTPNGKIDRRALAGLVPSEQPGAGRATPPRNETEAGLVAIWSEVLERADIGIEANFFALGGHSLLAVQAVARVREQFGVELPVRALFERSTLAEIAAEIAGLAPTPIPEREAISAAPGGEEDLAALLSTLGDLSDEEAEAYLAGIDSPDPAIAPGNPTRG